MIACCNWVIDWSRMKVKVKVKSLAVDHGSSCHLLFEESLAPVKREITLP